MNEYEQITIEDILDDLKNSSIKDTVLEDGLTAYEIADRLGLGAKKTAKVLKKMVQSGRLKCTRVEIVDVAGRKNFSFVYHP